MLGLRLWGIDRIGRHLQQVIGFDSRVARSHMEKVAHPRMIRIIIPFLPTLCSDETKCVCPQREF